MELESLHDLHDLRSAAGPMTTGVSVIPVGSLPESQMKEQLSIAYLRMVASAAGCSTEQSSTDFNASDISVVSSAEYSMELFPGFEVQLKCTSQNVVKDDYIIWSIDRRTHYRLTARKRARKAILAVLVVPTEIDGWLDHTEERLLTASTMYWIHGKDIAEIPDGQETITVHLPRRNIFTRDQLLAIMEDIGEGRL